MPRAAVMNAPHKPTNARFAERAGGTRFDLVGNHFLCGLRHRRAFAARAARLDAAKLFGADELISVAATTAQERLERLRALTGGRGADITIDATGVPSAVREGMQRTHNARRYVNVGQYADARDVTMNPHLDLNKKHLEVRESWGSDDSHFYKMVRVLARHGARIGWEKMLTREHARGEMKNALRAVARGEVVKAVVNP